MTQLAGFWRRFLAYIIDAIIVGVVSGIVEAIIRAAVHASGADTTGITVRGSVVGLVLGLLYFGYMWSLNGQTLTWRSAFAWSARTASRCRSGWGWCATC